MNERQNRREEMLAIAGELFVRQGYIGTSTRQIAEAVGCTKAALYYHFKQGKEELYQEVFKLHCPDFGPILSNCEGAATLSDLILCLATNMVKHQPERINRMRWVIAEFPNLDEGQREMLRERKKRHLDQVSDLLGRFIANRQEAEHVATLMLGAMVGYDQLFVQMESEPPDGKSREAYVQFFAECIAARYEG